MSRALIIDESMQLRSTMKQLAEHCGHFVEVEAVQNFEQARINLALGKNYSFIFVSTSFDSSYLAKFVEDARSFPGTSMSTIVAFGTGEDGTVDAVASSMLVGVHGFMFDNFTVERLNEIIDLAGRAQAQGTHLRLKAATGLILSDILDNVSREQGIHPAEPGQKNHDLWDRVQNSFDVYKHLTGESLGTAVAINLQKIAPSKRVPEYRGVSQRVRGLLENGFKNQIKRIVQLGVRQNKPPPGH